MNAFLNQIKVLTNYNRSMLVFFYDVTCTIGMLFIAMFSRHPLEIVIEELSANNYLIVLSTLFSFTLSFLYFGLYRGMWRFASVKDLIRIFKAVLVGTSINMLILFIFIRLEGVPRTVVLIHPALLILGLGGARFFYRLYRDQDYSSSERSEYKRVLIIGAGNGGIKLARDLRNNPEMPSIVVGYLDDDPSKLGRTINGVPVVGKSTDVAIKAKELDANLIVLAIPSIDKKESQRVLGLALQSGIQVKTLPKLTDVLLGKSRAMQLNEVSPEDLLGRDAVELDRASITHMIEARKVIVTGAGGSIGSEICRQVAHLNPEVLILFELSEFLLYEIEMELRRTFPDLALITIVGDVRNSERLRLTFKKYLPEVVIHAAAYKQVPLMERNPLEAVRTNIFGTQNLARISREFKAMRFVMISTDKAVNPTNVMGATKRVAEMIVNAEQAKSNETVYTVVRFGNVLGSNGSVIPLFKRQIELGGPVTVTHPDITRYFMSIPEACQLVLQSASMSNLGEIFVLDMGKPVKIIDLARQMISIAGLVPDVDIKIEYTGLREGEKLYEELLADEETTTQSHHKSIRVGMRRGNCPDFNSKVQSLLSTTEETSNQEIHFLIKALVPEFKSYILDREETEENRAH